MTATLTAEDVAALLNIRPATFLKKRAALERQGFPPRVPGCNVWSRALVEGWINSQPAAPDPLAAHRHALEIRIAGRAA